MREIFAVLLVLILGTGFGLYLLLRSNEIAQPPTTFTGYLNGTTSGNITLSQDGNNYFSTPDYAMRSVFLFLTGDWSSTSYWDTNRYVDVFKILFSFTTAILLLNVLIALMTQIVDDMQEGRHEVWLRTKAGIIAEIEVYWLFPWERFNQNWFPDLIFYEASADLVEQQEAELIKEEEKLKNAEESSVQKIDRMTNEITTLKKDMGEMVALLKNVLQQQAISVVTGADSSSSIAVGS
ncbi:hypothetical protein BC938DRAFT_482373 [Jimgerdemannia flammicorona]|uniref:Ion transport domain-containing protein n=2 Tax=Jimgerdemannia flammicorona TaxID=994334 RepID=A0A433QWH4_9FUNG|nr:hypothetical protein BC938DRAFT_482373 [Jimgerdemannia flammicorona]